MIIQNGIVFDEDRVFRKHDIYIKDGILCGEPETAGKPGEEVIDADGLYVIPGLVDIHSHGAVGEDFSDGNMDGLRKILEYEKASGITSYCPTSMTLPKEHLLSVFAMADQAADLLQQKNYARMLGMNMEGPFLDPGKKGAHAEEHILLPEVDFFRKCNQNSGNRIRLVTLAPNREGAMEFIRELHGEVVISVGHTAADYTTAKMAMEAGAKHVTHLFNAMPPFAHREPGVVGAAADTPGCMVELICDGIHVHESMVRAAFSLFPERVVLISDSMRAAGLNDGSYTLGGQQVTVHGRRAELADGTIAGSATNLFDCMCTAISFGIPKEEAVAAATINPAKSIGCEDRVGSIAPGKYADLLLLDEAFQLVRVI